MYDLTRYLVFEDNTKLFEIFIFFFHLNDKLVHWYTLTTLVG